MPHCELGDYRVRHPDFYVQPPTPLEDKVTRAIDIICWTLAIALTPVIAIVLSALYVAWSG